MTLNGVIAVILRYFTKFGIHYVKLVDLDTYCLQLKRSQKNVVFDNCM